MKNLLRIDIPQHIASVMPDASKAGGAYLSALGKTDCAKMSKSEWHGFLKAILTGVPDAHGNIAGGTCISCPINKLFDLAEAVHRQRQPGEDEIPF